MEVNNDSDDYFSAQNCPPFFVVWQLCESLNVVQVSSGVSSGGIGRIEIGKVALLCWLEKSPFLILSPISGSLHDDASSVPPHFAHL